MQGSRCNFIVHGDDAPNRTIDVILPQNDMTTALSHNTETHAFQGFNGFPAGYLR
jgi:hypothetical protein